jgi:hypothetical protein
LVCSGFKSGFIKEKESGFFRENKEVAQMNAGSCSIGVIDSQLKGLRVLIFRGWPRGVSWVLDHLRHENS